MNVRSENKPSRGRPLVDDKRRLLLDAALRMFAERGYHGTAVPEVAVEAGVGTGTLYRYFANKEALVNEVYRDAKGRLAAVLLVGAPEKIAVSQTEVWFTELWRRLGAFAIAEPDAFRFLEMQDHALYLDEASRQMELAVLAPLWLAGTRLAGRSQARRGAPTEVLMALVWGAFIGLIKAGRLGYLSLDARLMQEAGAACWRMIAPPPPTRPKPVTPKRGRP